LRVAADQTRRARRAILYGLLGTLLIAPSAGTSQSSSASYAIPRQSIDAGGGRATSPSYVLHGTTGQPDAGTPLTSASFTLRGGFHLAAAGAPLPDPLFADGFEPP
jgi:hypothetical protein